MCTVTNKTYSPSLQQILLGGVTGKLLHDNISEGNASKADHLTVDASDGLRAIDQDLQTENHSRSNRISNQTGN